MTILFLARLLLKRAYLRNRYFWTRDKINFHQQTELKKLRHFATVNSPFYRQFHKGYEGRSLQDLPVLSKHILMEHFNTVVTDHAVKKEHIENFYVPVNNNKLFLNKYHVNKTSGSTGQPAQFLFNTQEWLTILSSYARVNDWAEINIGFTRRNKLAMVCSTVPWHQSAMTGNAFNQFIPSLQIDATESIDSIVTKLNIFEPDQLVVYSSTARLLADEQINGSLHITPVSIMCVSEVLSNSTRLLIHKAWNIQPFNIFGATETAAIASECTQHRGMHIYEDLLIVENVDNNNNPVPSGTYGDKILVTVLFSRTLPLIRYEISDSIKISPDNCSCGKAFTLIESVQGRAEDFITMIMFNNTIQSVHPNVFHEIFDQLPVLQWQIILKKNGLHVYYIPDSSLIPENTLYKEIENGLTRYQLKTPHIHLHKETKLLRTKLGKLKLISSEL